VVGVPPPSAAGSLEMLAFAEADPVDVPQHDAVALPQPRARIGHAAVTAVLGDDRRGAAQVRARHRREEVVFDLVVEPAHQRVDEPAAADVAAHQYLAAEEVEPGALRHQRHALVVRRERHAHVEPEQAELDREEHGRLVGREHEEHEREVADEPDGEERDLDRAPRHVLSHEHAVHARHVQRDPLEEQDREEERALVRHEPAQERGMLAFDAVGRHGDHRELDVGVDAELVGVGVMTGVLVLPPAVAHADEQVADDQADPVVPSAGPEDLAVGRIVTEERDLGEEHGEPHGREHLPPGIADPDEDRDRAGEHDRNGRELGPVVAVAPPHEAGALDDPGEVREVAVRGRGTRPGSQCVVGHDDLLSRTVHRAFPGGPRRHGDVPVSAPTSSFRLRPGPPPDRRYTRSSQVRYRPLGARGPPSKL
jgi:hypothetical protein